MKKCEQLNFSTKCKPFKFLCPTDILGITAGSNGTVYEMADSPANGATFSSVDFNKSGKLRLFKLNAHTIYQTLDNIQMPKMPPF